MPNLFQALVNGMIPVFSEILLILIAVDFSLQTFVSRTLSGSMIPGVPGGPPLPAQLSNLCWCYSLNGSWISVAGAAWRIPAGDRLGTGSANHGHLGAAPQKLYEQQ